MHRFGPAPRRREDHDTIERERFHGYPARRWYGSRRLGGEASADGRALILVNAERYHDAKGERREPEAAGERA